MPVGPQKENNSVCLRKQVLFRQTRVREAEDREGTSGNAGT
jgi:hypothetical protein